MLSAYVLREDNRHGGRVPSKYRRQNNRHVDCGPLNERRSKRESERCELVLNAVFYWEPMEVYQKRCDMTTLRFLFLFLIRAALFWILCMHTKVALQ